jgi:hypothetical protein
MILGIGYYFKKHVPDKFDKFLSYGMDVNSPISEKPPGLNWVISGLYYKNTLTIISDDRK